LIVGIGVVEPIELLQNSVGCIVCRVVVLGAELGLHRIDELGVIGVTPLLELSNVESDQHIVVFMYQVMTMKHAGGTTSALIIWV